MLHKHPKNSGRVTLLQNIFSMFNNGESYLRSPMVITHERFIRILVLLFAALLGAALYYRMSPVTIQQTLLPYRIHHLRGFAYAVVLAQPQGWPLLVFQGDDYEVQRSRLQLYENGDPYGQAHAPQNKVEDSGEGRYLHLRENELYLSTLDNSDPSRNGRIYSVVAPVVPRGGLIFALLMFETVLLSYSLFLFRLKSASCGHNRATRWIAPLSFFLVTLIWLWRMWAPAPLIINTGDGGNVASIVAGWLHRDRFLHDLVLSNPSQSSFYMTVAIPVTMLLAQVTGDIGQAYLLLMGPILMLQLFGFYRLGQSLYHSRIWAWVLAMLSIPPVYVFSGELWGVLSSPLTRSLYGALFPFLLSLLLRWKQSGNLPFVAMLVCGIGVYIHPVSAPSVALACWIALLACKPDSIRWGHHFEKMVLAGGCFLLTALPFAIIFLSGFPSGEVLAGSDSGAQAARAMAEAVGSQYYHVGIAIQMLLKGGVNNPSPTWGWVWVVWLAGVAGLLKIDQLQPKARDDARLLRYFLLGLIIASVGIAWSDQYIAGLLARRPVEIDLIRNIRFIVPILLIGTVWLLAAFERRVASVPYLRASILMAGPVICLLWWYQYPTPLSVAVNRLLDGGIAVNELNRTANARIVDRIGRLPPHSTILPLPQSLSQGEVELVGLGVRYGALQPVAHLWKDVNILSYSGSPHVSDWLDTESELNQIATMQDERVNDVLSALLRSRRVDYVLLYTPSATSALISSLSALGVPTAVEGPWWLIRVRALQ